jgi:sigma-54 specific flagellar transcriptional regulator A
MEGDIAGAERHARAAFDAVSEGSEGGDPERGSTRLHARNVLGKILLAGSAWQQAEQHFAGDACEAALLGDASAELRARLNRSIALLSSGRLDEARAMLAAVLEEGECRGELRAVAYALTNLATIAILKREYAEALRLSERAFEARRRLGDRVSLALLIANLAELKLMLGQTAEAEQTLAFGRKACGPGMPGARASHFAYTAALIHLERGQTVEAKAELRRAFSTVHGSNHGARLGECHRLAARVALEDGDLAAAEAALMQAASLAETPREKAWAALLSALHARAAGEPFGDLAADLLDRTRGTDDPELLREAHVLLHHAAVAREDARAARAHLEAATSVRDQIASALPEDLRRRYLARRDLAELGRVEAAFLAERPSLAPRASIEAEDRPSLREMPRLRAEAVAPALRRMVGRTAAMAALATAIKKVGPSDATVLVHGESGTGKELVAEAIHEASARRSGPLVKVNCAALVETLLLSELFGHEKGSFTGAAARRRGRFEAAEGGTLFLDEIGDISPRTQVALLRVLQDKTYERVGGVTPIRANVRIVCATHRDLAGMVSRGEFREDLYYRLRGVVLEVPALRNRLADLGTVAEAILDRVGAERGMPAKRLSPAALDGLSRHAWPGNVRELENAIRAAALFADGEELELVDFTSNVASLRELAAPLSPAPQAVLPAMPVLAVVPDVDAGTLDASDLAPMTQPSKSARSAAASPSGEAATDVAYAAVRGGVSLSDLKRDIERECIARALAETGGNITRAAGLLGMKRPRLSQLVKQYGFGGGGAAGEVEIEAEDGE